ncbi:MAG TPA: EAL domain-containing protein [Acidiferrobacter sp.]|nr:EAL domain-containing protein [Acidiferrobacter sp.]
MNKTGKDASSIEFLHKLVREIDLPKFFRLAAKGVANLLGADGAALIVHEEPDLLRYRFFHGLPAAHKQLLLYAFNDQLGVAGAALHAHKALLVTDYPHSAYALPECVNAGVQASLCSPVMANGKVLGILAVTWFSPPQRLPDAGDYRMLGVVSDFIGAALFRFQREQHLRDLAMHDPLTGTANRNLFFDRLQHAMTMATRRERLLAVVVFDIDNFKTINDQFGHSVGDALLIEVRLRVQALIRDGDTLARLGGDEFALILEDIRCYDEIEIVVGRIRESLSMRWGSKINQIDVSVSLGATIYPLDDGDGQALLRNADAAMYEAKRGGGNRGLFFSDSMALAHAQKSKLVSELQLALDNDEILLYFQPIIEIATGRAVSAEALIRWQHPTLGLLRASEFMIAMEHPYNSLKLDRWLVAQAIKTLGKWQARGIFKMLHINLSAASIENHQFFETLHRALAAHEDTVDPHYLGIDLVEWSTVRDIECARQMIMSCKALGVSVALDDFGTGPASLQHLRLLPIDTIKIDRSFVAGLTTDKADRVLVQSMVGAAHVFGIAAIAEGIESVEQKDLLAAMGCAFGRGYLFSPPVPEESLWADQQ